MIIFETGFKIPCHTNIFTHRSHITFHTAAMNTRFVPQLHIPKGTFELDFYQNVFRAELKRSWKNDDGSFHVAEMTIDGALFHFHEENTDKGVLTPEKCAGVTTTLGLMVDDVDTIMNRAASQGALVLEPAQDYDYGFRQGKFRDLLGHVWLIEKVI
jgi:PhnB protein